MLVFAVRDKKADSFMTPFFMEAAGLAIRSLTDLVNSENKKENIISMHPEDFELWQLTDYDQETASFGTDQELRRKLCEAIDLVKE